MRTAFLEQIVGHGCLVTVVVRPEDKIDLVQPPTLDNFDIPRAHLRYIQSVVFEEHTAGDSDFQVLYRRS